MLNTNITADINAKPNMCIFNVVIQTWRHRIERLIMWSLSPFKLQTC